MTHGLPMEKGTNDHPFPVSQMLWNCREDSREFYHPSNEYKSLSHLRRRE